MSRNDKEKKRKRKLEKQARKRERKREKNEAKKQLKEGDNMFGFGNKVASKKMGYWANQGTIPETGTDSGLLSTVLFKQSTLDKIGEICLPAAGASEFQVHYRCLQLVISRPETNERLAITLPTVFFNMPQKVSSASVDFNLNEVAEISEKVAPISEALAQKYYKAFPTELFQSLGFEIDARETEIGSMHRHPGAFGFSATDLDNKAENPGVIFRTLGAEDRIQVDSVMYIPNKTVTIYTTETRIVDVKPVEDGIEGTYYRTPTFSYILEDTADVSKFGPFFGRKTETSKEYSFKFDKDSIEEEYPEMESLLSSFLNELDAAGEEYEPTLILDPAMIEEEYSYYRNPVTTYGHGYNRGTGYHGGSKTPVVPSTRHTETDYYFDDEYDTKYVYTDDGTLVTRGSVKAPFNENKPLVVRPSWRKIQTIGAIHDLGIPEIDSQDIDGSGSVKDILAIQRALKNAGHGIEDIKEFLTTYGYTQAMIIEAATAQQDIKAEILEPEKEVETPAESKVIASNVYALLRALGITVIDYKNIDGSETIHEIHTILDTLVRHGLKEEAINAFFVSAGYSKEVLEAADAA